MKNHLKHSIIIRTLFHIELAPTRILFDSVLQITSISYEYKTLVPVSC